MKKLKCLMKKCHALFIKLKLRSKKMFIFSTNTLSVKLISLRFAIPELNCFPKKSAVRMLM